MQFDLYKFLTLGVEPAVCEFDLFPSSDAFPDYQLKLPCPVRFEARREGERAVLELCCEATVQAECARCLEPVETTFTVRQQYDAALDELQSGECDLPVAGRGVLDVDELAASEIFLQVPPVILCSETCKGLCPVCGRPRKLGCGCEERQADERLSVFEQLLS